MRKNAILIFITIVCIALITVMIDHMPEPKVKNVPVAAEPVAEPAQAPNFTFETINGKSLQLADFKGKPVILHFWATWCGPCLVEIPSLFKLANDLKDINIIAISLDLDKPVLHRFLEKQNFANASNLYQVWDEKKTIANDIFQSYYLPESIVIDAEERMVRKFTGSVDWQDKAIIAYLKDAKLRKK